VSCSVDCDVLYSLEDLFLLPPDFQALVVQMNQEVQAGGISMDQVRAHSDSIETPDRDAYEPIARLLVHRFGS
jgi:hypothetical protein